MAVYTGVIKGNEQQLKELVVSMFNIGLSHYEIAKKVNASGFVESSRVWNDKISSAYCIEVLGMRRVTPPLGRKKRGRPFGSKNKSNNTRANTHSDFIDMIEDIVTSNLSKDVKETIIRKML